jgi:hypothetical protein
MRSHFLKLITSVRDKGRLIVKLNSSLLRGRVPILVQYDLNLRTRYGRGKPYGGGDNPNPKLYNLIRRNEDQYRANLRRILQYTKYLEEIPIHHDKNNPTQPCWLNGFIPALDAITLYGFLSIFHPKIYLEVGSGNSTKFARKAIRDNSLKTKIISIDPLPRCEIDTICDEIIRKPLEDVDLGIFSRLNSNDILFMDGSDYVFPNSDVVALFLDILPRSSPGVIIHFHDIFLPFDYPNEQLEQYYSEQYILAAYLLAEGNKSEIIQANTFVSNQDDLHSLTIPLWTNIGLADHFISGCSFWIKMK